MTYLALARKYRPQTFDDIVGQDHVTRTLTNAITGDRIHHAYLFTGIRGVGKTTAARVFAKALNCEHGPTPKPCNVCPQCLEITKGSSMDVLEIDGASNRGIEDVRELRETVRYSTARDRFRIVIIDEVHMLTEAAFNALLKTLEEPPSHVRFILATTDPQKLPATILSRCQRFDFRRVEGDVLAGHLLRICGKEGYNVAEDAVRMIIRESGGSVRDSMSLLDQLLAAAEGDLTAEKVGEILGLADQSRIMGMIRAIMGHDAVAALSILHDVHMTGFDLRSFVSELLQLVRDMVVLKMSRGSRSLVDRSEADGNVLQGLIRDFSAQDLNEYFRILLEGIEMIRQSEYPHFVAEELVIRLCNLRESHDIGLLIKHLADLEARFMGLEVPDAPLMVSPSALQHVEVPLSDRPEPRSTDKLKIDATEPSQPSLQTGESASPEPRKVEEVRQASSAPAEQAPVPAPQEPDAVEEASSSLAEQAPVPAQAEPEAAEEPEVPQEAPMPATQVSEPEEPGREDDVSESLPAEDSSEDGDQDDDEDDLESDCDSGETGELETTPPRVQSLAEQWTPTDLSPEGFFAWLAEAEPEDHGFMRHSTVAVGDSGQVSLKITRGAYTFIERSRIEELLHSYFGPQADVEIEVTEEEKLDGSPVVLQERANKERELERRERVTGSVLTRTALDLFSARVTSINLLPEE